MIIKTSGGCVCGHSPLIVSVWRHYTMPLVMTCRHCIRLAMGQCPHGKTVTGQATHASFTTQQSATQQPVAHPLPWSLRLPDGRLFPLHFDCKRCEMTVSAR